VLGWEGVRNHARQWRFSTIITATAATIIKRVCSHQWSQFREHVGKKKTPHVCLYSTPLHSRPVDM